MSFSQFPASFWNIALVDWSTLEWTNEWLLCQSAHQFLFPQTGSKMTKQLVK
jgi:hypothetical protein